MSGNHPPLKKRNPERVRVTLGVMFSEWGGRGGIFSMLLLMFQKKKELNSELYLSKGVFSLIKESVVPKVNLILR